MTVRRRLLILCVCVVVACAGVIVISVPTIATAAFWRIVLFHPEDGHGPWDIGGKGEVSAENLSRYKNDMARYAAELAREAARLAHLRPWQEAGTARLSDLRQRLIRFADEMRDAPIACREGLRARLPEGWTGSGVSLGPTGIVGSHDIWRVTGVLTVRVDGAQRTYRYRCDFRGPDELVEVVIADPRGNHDTMVLLSRP